MTIQPWMVISQLNPSHQIASFCWKPLATIFLCPACEPPVLLHGTDRPYPERAPYYHVWFPACSWKGTSLASMSSAIEFEARVREPQNQRKLEGLVERHFEPADGPALWAGRSARAQSSLGFRVLCYGC
jgi:hypothetical protein